MFFAKGNATTESLGKNVPESSVVELRNLAIKEQIDLTIVGPEAPLVEGIVDEFRHHGLRIFGAKQRAAHLEGSKAFSKKFMQTYNIKTASAQVVDSYEAAKTCIEKHAYPLVIKASGLAGGKGVVICDTLAEAQATIHDFMIRRIYGDAGIQLVIEEYLEGFEASIIGFSNGSSIFTCIPVKDYKKVSDGDRGANTGGMGSVAPSPQFTQQHQADFEANILKPTLEGLRAELLDFKGFIFFGLMVTKKGCYLLEYNMRMGDPETQVILPLMENKLLDVIEDCLDGKEVELKFSDKKAVCLVMCSGGYPRNIETGFEIHGLDQVKQSEVLFAGAAQRADKVVTTGGRVLCLVATGATYEEAREKVYKDAIPVNFDYAFYREDIAKF